ncbi:MAG: endolytic transglycosylase MltG [Legionellaceae bacterium]|nr:endolytic transglycosylase MltG [Legionellaceae bacterium]
MTYLAAILFVVGVCFGFEVYRSFYCPMPLQEHESIIFRIDKSSSATTFVHVLDSQRLVNSSRLFLYFIRLQGLSTRLKAGIYQIKPGESVQQLLRRVVAGDVLKETFRIIEGTTQQQIATKLTQAPYLSYKDSDWNDVFALKLDQAHRCESTSRLWDANRLSDCFMTLAKTEDSRPITEGLLLADTYQYTADSDAKQLLTHAYDNLKHYLLASWLHRNPALPYKNPYELLIVASILEKEAAISDERRLISGVIVNRLSSHMPLQMDPTVIYALGSTYTGKLTHDNLQIDSPYNSYRYRGLPPTPITMVGKDAIDAASHPHMTHYYYFVAKGDGTHMFSETYEQQRQAVDRYIRKHK